MRTRILLAKRTTPSIACSKGVARNKSILVLLSLSIVLPTIAFADAYADAIPPQFRYPVYSPTCQSLHDRQYSLKTEDEKTALAECESQHSAAEKKYHEAVDTAANAYYQEVRDNEEKPLRQKENAENAAAKKIYNKEQARIAKLPDCCHLGMTADEVRASKWGRSWEVHRTTTANSVREQWVYRGNRFLYFDNGVLTGMQD
jgi:hypothetical protein